MPEKRSYYEQLARERGYEPTSTVNKDLTLLVAAAPDGGSSKLTKARKAGVKIVGLDEWLSNSGAEQPDAVTDKVVQRADSPAGEPQEVEFNFDW
jgi:hypothetical protein